MQLAACHDYTRSYRQTKPETWKMLQDIQILTRPDPNTTYLGVIRSSSPRYIWPQLINDHNHPEEELHLADFQAVGQ